MRFLPTQDIVNKDLDRTVDGGLPLEQCSEYDLHSICNTHMDILQTLFLEQLPFLYDMLIQNLVDAFQRILHKQEMLPCILVSAVYLHD